MKIVEIDWVDATSYTNEWVAPNTSIKLLACRSVGYLITKNKDEVVLTQSWSSDSGEVHNRFIIPRGCIKNIRELK